MLLDDSELYRKRYSSVCSRCRNWEIGKQTCAAFPSGIPEEIWDDRNDHTKPYPGDNGIQFEEFVKESYPGHLGRPGKSPYIKKLGTVGPFTIWEVDGEWVRKNKDKNFTNFGQHYAQKYIPKTEFWIDEGFNKKEYQPFLQHMLTEFKIQQRGGSFEEAHKRALTKEQSVRDKIDGHPPIGKPNSDKYTKETDPRLREIGKYPGGIILEVDAKKVRDNRYEDYTEGGHGWVYKWIPKGEVWLDNTTIKGRQVFYAIHEVHEEADMKKGMSYEKAHERANVVEQDARAHPDKIDGILKKLGITLDKEYNQKTKPITESL